MMIEISNSKVSKKRKLICQSKNYQGAYSLYNFSSKYDIHVLKIFQKKID